MLNYLIGKCDIPSTRARVTINYATLVQIRNILYSVVFLIITFSSPSPFIVLEFITAQSPYRMRGMLIGTSYCIRGAFAFITALLILFFTLGYKDHPLPAALSISCSTPLILAVISIALIGLVVFIVVARRYKCRERDEHVNTRIFIEKYYYGT